MPKEKEDLSESVITHLRNFASSIGVIGAASYIAGYLISNFYIGKFGGSAFNLVQSRYFATGGLFFVLTSLSLIGPIVTFAIIDRTEKREKRGDTIKNFILVFLGFLLSAITIWYAGSILTSLNSSANFVLSRDVRRTGISGAAGNEYCTITPYSSLLHLKMGYSKIAGQKSASLPDLAFNGIWQFGYFFIHHQLVAFQ